MFYYLLLTLLGLCIFHIATRYGRMGRMVSDIPAAKPLLPIIGHALIFIKADRRKYFFTEFKKFLRIILAQIVTRLPEWNKTFSGPE